MALVNPFLLPTKTHFALHVSPPPSKQILLWTNPSSSFSFNLNKGLSSSRRKHAGYVTATADVKAASTVLDGEEDQKVLVGPSSEQERRGERELAAYDWKEEWYPLYLTKNVPHDAPLGLTVFDKNLVLFKDGNDQIQCYEDRCPHRLAKLSEGQLIDGRLECLYHGWQFEGEGKCVKIPQLPADAKIPRSACVKTYEVYPSEGIHRRWDNGYRITSTAATYDQAALVLSIPRRKPTDETQETLRTSDFPSTHVKEKWAKNLYIASICYGRTVS